MNSLDFLDSDPPNQLEKENNNQYQHEQEQPNIIINESNNQEESSQKIIYQTENPSQDFETMFFKDQDLDNNADNSINNNNNSNTSNNNNNRPNKNCEYNVLASTDPPNELSDESFNFQADETTHSEHLVLEQSASEATDLKQYLNDEEETYDEQPMILDETDALIDEQPEQNTDTSSIHQQSNDTFTEHQNKPNDIEMSQENSVFINGDIAPNQVSVIVADTLASAVDYVSFNLADDGDYADKNLETTSKEIFDAQSKESNQLNNEQCEYFEMVDHRLISNNPVQIEQMTDHELLITQNQASPIIHKDNQFDFNQNDNNSELVINGNLADDIQQNEIQQKKQQEKDQLECRDLEEQQQNQIQLDQLQVEIQNVNQIEKVQLNKGQEQAQLEAENQYQVDPDEQSQNNQLEPLRQQESISEQGECTQIEQIDSTNTKNPVIQSKIVIERIQRKETTSNDVLLSSSIGSSILVRHPLFLESIDSNFNSESHPTTSSYKDKNEEIIATSNNEINNCFTLKKLNQNSLKKSDNIFKKMIINNANSKSAKKSPRKVKKVKNISSIDKDIYQTDSDYGNHKSNRYDDPFSQESFSSSECLTSNHKINDSSNINSCLNRPPSLSLSSSSIRGPGTLMSDDNTSDNGNGKTNLSSSSSVSSALSASSSSSSSASDKSITSKKKRVFKQVTHIKTYEVTTILEYVEEYDSKTNKKTKKILSTKRSKKLIRYQKDYRILKQNDKNESSLNDKSTNNKLSSEEENVSKTNSFELLPTTSKIINEACSLSIPLDSTSLNKITTKDQNKKKPDLKSTNIDNNNSIQANSNRNNNKRKSNEETNLNNKTIRSEKSPMAEVTHGDFYDNNSDENPEIIMLTGDELIKDEPIEPNNTSTTIHMDVTTTNNNQISKNNDINISTYRKTIDQAKLDKLNSINLKLSSQISDPAIISTESNNRIARNRRNKLSNRYTSVETDDEETSINNQEELNDFTNKIRTRSRTHNFREKHQSKDTSHQSSKKKLTKTNRIFSAQKNVISFKKIRFTPNKNNNNQDSNQSAEAQAQNSEPIEEISTIESASTSEVAQQKKKQKQKQQQKKQQKQQQPQPKSSKKKQQQQQQQPKQQEEYLYDEEHVEQSVITRNDLMLSNSTSINNEIIINENIVKETVSGKNTQKRKSTTSQKPQQQEQISTESISKEKNAKHQKKSIETDQNGITSIAINNNNINTNDNNNASGSTIFEQLYETDYVSPLDDNRPARAETVDQDEPNLSVLTDYVQNEVEIGFVDENNDAININSNTIEAGLNPLDTNESDIFKSNKDNKTKKSTAKTINQYEHIKLKQFSINLTKIDEMYPKLKTSNFVNISSSFQAESQKTLAQPIENIEKKSKRLATRKDAKKEVQKESKKSISAKTVDKEINKSSDKSILDLTQDSTASASSFSLIKDGTLTPYQKKQNRSASSIASDVVKSPFEMNEKVFLLYSDGMYYPAIIKAVYPVSNNNITKYMYKCDFLNDKRYNSKSKTEKSKKENLSIKKATLTSNDYYDLKYLLPSNVFEFQDTIFVFDNDDYKIAHFDGYSKNENDTDDYFVTINRSHSSKLFKMEDLAISKKISTDLYKRHLNNASPSLKAMLGDTPPSYQRNNQRSKRLQEASPTIMENAKKKPKNIEIECDIQQIDNSAEMILSDNEADTTTRSGRVLQKQKYSNKKSNKSSETNQDIDLLEELNTGNAETINQQLDDTTRYKYNPDLSAKTSSERSSLSLTTCRAANPILAAFDTSNKVNSNKDQQSHVVNNSRRNTKKAAGLFIDPNNSGTETVRKFDRTQRATKKTSNKN